MGLSVVESEKLNVSNSSHEPSTRMHGSGTLDSCMDCAAPHDDGDGDQVKVAHERKPTIFYGVRIQYTSLEWEKPFFFFNNRMGETFVFLRACCWLAGLIAASDC